MASTREPRTASKRIADVASPGESAPASNSKSVIISSRPVIKDPMMADEAPQAAQAPKAVAATESPAATEVSNKDRLESASGSELTAKETPTKAEETPANEELTSEIEPETDKEPPKTDKSDPANEEAQAAIQKLTTSKEYYLPINTIEKRRSKQVVLLGIVVSVLLLLLWVNIALDAGLINLGGVQPLTHFFSS